MNTCIVGTPDATGPAKSFWKESSLPPLEDAHTRKYDNQIRMIIIQSIDYKIIDKSLLFELYIFKYNIISIYQ